LKEKKEILNLLFFITSYFLI